jgi:hypothetical protein
MHYIVSSNLSLVVRLKDMVHWRIVVPGTARDFVGALLTLGEPTVRFSYPTLIRTSSSLLKTG